jgi:hypothetical protein
MSLVAAPEAVPVVAGWMMGHVAWRNLGETLAAL